MVSGRIYVTESQIVCGTREGTGAVLYPVSGGYVHPTAKQCNYTYTHPSTKQCSWSPNLSSYATKTELNEVRNMIESSSTPVVVGSGTSRVSNISINMPSCDYVEIKIYSASERLSDQGTCAKGGSTRLIIDQYSSTTVIFSLNSSGTSLSMSLSEGYVGANISWVAYG